MRTSLLAILTVSFAVAVAPAENYRSPRLPCPKQSCAGIACAEFLKASCTAAEYQAERCACCKHCPAQDVSVQPPTKCPTKVCNVFCTLNIKTSCTPEEYKAEECACCKHCPIRAEA